VEHHTSRWQGVDPSSLIVGVVQARLGSVRLPNKVLAELGGVSALQFLLRRLSRAKTLDSITVAIPSGSDNDFLFHEIQNWGYEVFRGSEHDVLRRFSDAAKHYEAASIVRITGDCPLVDPVLVDKAVQQFQRSGAHYLRTSEEYPDGFDIEVFNSRVLHLANDVATDRYDREHVTPWIQRNAETVAVLPSMEDFSSGRVTLDELDDLEVLRSVCRHFGNNEFTVDDVTKLMKNRADLFLRNQHLKRNEGARVNSGEKLWRRACNVIPNGNMLLSKRAEQFIPSGWPSYFSRAKGCQIWDLDSNKYMDLSLMGVGTNILGYGHPRVDEAVQSAVAAGNMSTLNCPEEVRLAERLCELHPWAEMVKFARTGGEICSIAVRIARVASGKPAVAVCGYHGWHDWYLSANLANDSALDGHLLPGLNPKGVPRQLKGLTRPFFYNDIDALRTILADDDVGTVIMEVERSTPPAPGFLKAVRSLTRAHGCVLVFDECTSAFRRNLGGLHLHYGVDPDIATFGKTLGNGYAITAAIGTREVMTAAQSTFISSTFWTDRIGPTAALAALDTMREEDAPARIHEIGFQIRKIWDDLAIRFGLKVTVSGLPALSLFGIEGLNPVFFRRELIYRMLREGFLANTAIFASIAHDSQVLKQYSEALFKVLSDIHPNIDALRVVETVDKSVPGFSRLA